MAVRSFQTDWEEYLEECPWSEDCTGAPYWIAEYSQNRMKTVVNEMLGESALSPDMAVLNGFNDHFIFVYGTLKRGFPASEMLKGATYVGRGWTALERFKLVQGDFPVALLDTAGTGPKSATGKAIQGEVYKVPTSRIKNLDTYEGNGQLYRRKRMNIHLETGKYKVCWMYIGIPGVFTAVNKECPVFTRNKTGLQYYTYTRKT